MKKKGRGREKKRGIRISQGKSTKGKEKRELYRSRKILRIGEK